MEQVDSPIARTQIQVVNKSKVLREGYDLAPESIYSKNKIIRKTNLLLSFCNFKQYIYRYISIWWYLVFGYDRHILDERLIVLQILK